MQEVFQEIENILRLAVLERQYGIVQPSAIIIGILGLDKIIFYPAPDTTKCKFKIVVYKNLPVETNRVLVGKLDATSKKLEFVGANTTNPTVQNYLQMLLFIVAIAYRDLLVCRNIIKQQGKPIDESKSRSTKRPPTRKLETIRYLPRIKRQIDKTFADPTRFVKTLKKVAPHIRTEPKRKLPPGHKPSDKARELAALYGYLGDFPVGETFVSPSTCLRRQTRRNTSIRRSISFPLPTRIILLVKPKRSQSQLHPLQTAPTSLNTAPKRY